MKKEHEITFGTLHPDGTLTNVRKGDQSIIKNCPFFILDPDHYRKNRSCKCHDPEYRKMMIKEWGYTKKSFKEKGII
jgi:hypothetical protein